LKSKIYIVSGLILVICGCFLLILSTKNLVPTAVENQTVVFQDNLKQISSSLPNDKTTVVQEETNLNDTASKDSIKINITFEDEKSIPSKSKQKDFTPKYIVVLGTFRERSNANSFLAELKSKANDKCYLFTMESFNYVVLSAHESRTLANNALKKSKLEGWVKKI
tara:strand:- start:826 stop:1323 length:498 start_codon:yes stop_codon:yes gene_type:complete